jgi:hypothetical protein
VQEAHVILVADSDRKNKINKNEIADLIKYQVISLNSAVCRNFHCDSTQLVFGDYWLKRSEA